MLHLEVNREHSLDKISESLGAMTPVQHVERKATEISTEVHDLNQAVKKNTKDDYVMVRDNMRELISSSMELLPNLVNVVREAESARMYESASGFIKMISELNASLIDINQKMGNEKQESQPQNNTTEVTNNTVFIGTGDDLFKRLSRRNNNLIIEGDQ